MATDVQNAPNTCTYGRTDSISDQVTDEEEEELDPRVQRELDQLNVASGEINQLENELDEARTKYRSIVSEMSNRMEVIAQDQKRCIRKSREYYKLVHEAKMAQSEALKAARQFQSATGVYTAAKETVALAERSLREESTSHTPNHASSPAPTAQLNSAWQEMLSNAVTKLMDAEKEKARCGSEHGRRASKFAELETRKQLLEKKFSRAIKKARPYFELKAQLDLRLMQQKQNVTDLQAAIKANKIKYKAALRRLEKISEDIHQSRSEKLWSQVPRMPGVGAETESICSGLSELALDSFDTKDDTDSASASVDGESMKDFNDGIDVVIGADDVNDMDESAPDGQSETTGDGKRETDKPETEKQQSDTNSIDANKPDTVKLDIDPDATDSDQLDKGKTATCNTHQAGASSIDSEEEVFEDAETGMEHNEHVDAKIDIDNDNVTHSEDEKHGDRIVSCDKGSNSDNSVEIDRGNGTQSKDNSSLKMQEIDNDELDKTTESLNINAVGNGPAGVESPDVANGSIEGVSDNTKEGVAIKTEVNENMGGDGGYAEINMREIERPSLSGEEEVE